MKDEESMGKTNNRKDNKTKDKQRHQMTSEEIRDALRTDDKDVIDTIYMACYEMMLREEERFVIIDSKGWNLFAMIGLAITLIFTIGGTLVEKVTNVSVYLFGCPLPWLVGFYILAFVLALAAGILTWFAVRVRSDYRWPDEKDLLNKEMIQSGADIYKRYMAVHYWKIFRNNYEKNTRKANLLKVAHNLFLGALLTLLPLAVIIGLYALARGGF